MSHLIGAVVFSWLGVRLLRKARGDHWRFGLYSVYVFAVVLLLSMSGVYHMLPEGSGGRAVLARLDLAAIFVLIAGTHTPVQGLYFRGYGRWAVLLLMWTIAVTGITMFSIFYDGLPRGMKTSVYLLMGWIAGGSGALIWRRFGFRAVRPLLAGGISYSVGVALLGFEWPTLLPGVIGPHELWHVAVLTGVALHWHFFAVHAHWPMAGQVPSARNQAPSR